VLSASPRQQVVKIVRDELIRILGSHQSRLRLSTRPSVILLVGLQGSGKTTTTGKLAAGSPERPPPIMVSVDVYRPAAASS